MKFEDYFFGALKSAALTGLALGLMLLALTLAGIGLNGHIDLELDTSVIDGVLSLVLFPVALCLLTLIASPVVFLLLYLSRRWRRREPGA